MSDSIKVAIKVRPLIRREKEDNLAVQWVVQDNSIVSTDPEMKKRGDGGFCFDHIFDMNASNSDVFTTVVKPIVDAAVNGFNGTVFAYGQTSSGKTYTMMGTPDEPGIIPLAVEYMFDAIASTAGREFLLRVSYLEIYNERVNDLLNTGNTDLKLKEDSSGQIILFCKEEITNCPENVLSIMKKGNKNKRIGETNMNERSSRSHTIFRITIESREAGGNSEGAIQVSQLNLVDLAGSERARQTGATGERFKEGRHINLSLSTLGLVIMQLSDSQDTQKHVNFRDSKLTRLLQNSLGGNAMTAIICAVTSAALEETQCTLSFASRAKSVKNKPHINEVMSDAALLTRYAKQLSKLQAELEKMKAQNRCAEVEEMETKLQEKDRINQMLEERIEMLKTRIVSGDTTTEVTFKSKSKRRQTWGGPGVSNQHLPVFKPTANLPTIREISFEKPHRKSIIQSADMMNQTFQTAFTDFELELFESERDRVNEDTFTDSDEEPFVTVRNTPRVTFRDDVFTIRAKNSISPGETSIEVTPEKCSMSTQTMSYQVSPSTPKHTLRQHISTLTNDYKELLEYTTLEKQLLCHENHCCVHEDEVRNKAEYSTEVKERLDRLNLAGECNIDRIIIKLCDKLDEAEEKSRQEMDSNKKKVKQFAELQKQIQNITSEKDEFEYMCRELRAQLKAKTVELDLKNMYEENMKEPEFKRIAELEKQVECLVSEKEKLERVNAELRTESTKEVAELQKQIHYVTSERDEFQHMRHELRTELTKTSLELEKLKNDPESVREEIITDVKELERQIEDITSEKSKLERVSVELNDRVLELEATVTSEHTAHRAAIEQVSKLQKKIENVTVERNQFEAELKLKITSLESEVREARGQISELESRIESVTSERNELQRVNTELKSKILIEETARQNALVKVCELEKQIEGMESEKNEFERLSGELNRNIAELESQIELERTANKNGMERTSQLEVEIGSITSERNELQRMTTVLDQKTSELESKIAAEQTASQNAMERISQLEIEIESVTTEKTEFERISVELSQKTSELESKIVVEQNVAEKICELEKQIESITSEKNEFERLSGELNRKITELESQMISERTASQNGMERISQLEVQIESVTSEKNEFERLSGELNRKITELESQTISEQTASQGATEEICELKKQIESITLEKNKFERLSGELNRKITELESQIISEQTASQGATEEICELKKQIESITLEKNKFERLSGELNRKITELESQIISEQTASQGATEEICELKKQIESITLEKNKFERLSGELNRKITELESQIISEQTASQGATEEICELKKQIESITLEKNKFERLNGEMNRKITELELQTISEQTASQSATEEICELKKQIENITSGKNEFERLSGELNRKITELESQIISEQTASQCATEEICELKKQIESITLEKNEFERLSGELNRKITELESQTISEQTASQGATEEICELKKQIESITLEKNEFERLSGELNRKITELELQTISEQTASQSATEEICELKKQIENITSGKNEFERLSGELNRKITELESQIISEQTASQGATEEICELKKQIESITLEKNEFGRLSGELNRKITELELQTISEQTASQGATEEICELKKQIESITLEKNEFERLSGELNRKITELELQTISEQTASQGATEEICELKKQIESITSGKNEFERLSGELNRKIAELESQIISEQTASQGATEKICELEKQIEGVISEKNEFERLSGELNGKITELESQMISERSASQNGMERISQLEVQIECVTSEKNEFERLSGELNRKITELESQMISERTASQNGMERICQLEVQIESVISEKNEFERLSGELNRKITELESHTISEQIASQDATEKIYELEKQIEGVISEKNEFERLSGELNGKITELESQMISERTASQNGMERISQLEVQIESVTSEKNEFERLSGELNRKITELESQTILEQTATQGAMEEICGLKKQIESITSEKKELEWLSGELNQKITKLESQSVSEQAASRSIMERISELSKEIENLISEKKELERVNSQLRDELDKKQLESEERSDRDYINGNSNLKTVPIENQDRKDQMEDQSLLLSCSRFNESNADVSSLMITMEAERSQLEETLHLKSVELNEIKGDVLSLKMDIENLQKAIYLLTTENMDMATKLTTEQETAKQAELNLQKTIDELYARISHVTSEKINLESDLASLMDQLESMRSRVPVAQHSEDQLFATYQSKINKLTEENIELSASIAEKNKELENVKESKSLLYDHECIYREKVAVLTQEKKSLLVENSELSSDLIDKIEDNDSLKEQCDVLKSKVEQLLAMKNNAAGNNVEHLVSENNVLKAELAELKRKVAILSDENVKFSSNLLETMENLDSSRNEGPGSNTLHLSTILNETGQEVVQEETREALVKRVATLQEKIDHLTRLNKKLSDLKLTSCSQCAHLKNLNESRRALKLETKALNHKLEDLQRKFVQKCADTEMLKRQLNQGLNLSAQCVSPNVSFGDEMNVSFVEEKIQCLNEELQALRVDHEKLSVMYEDKCNEHEQLQSGLITDGSISEDSKKRERRDRIKQIRRHIDCLKGEVDKLNANSVNFTAMLDQFKQDKANLVEEIKVLQATNEELRQKVSDESTATEKVRILENELTNMSNEIEQFSVREKELETQRLLLEVELEDLKDEKKSKSGLIDQLNQHISSLKNELDSTARQKNELAASNATKDKYIEQLEFLKKHCEEMEIEQVRSMEIEQRAALRIKELEAYIESLQRRIVQHEGLCKDLHERGLHLENLLHESEQEKARAVEIALMEFKTNFEIRYKNEFNSMSLEYEHRVKESENNLQKLNDTLNKYVEENLNITQEVTRLRNIEEKFNAMRDEMERVSSTGKTLSSDNEKLSEELNYIRKCMMTELRSLRCDISAADLSNKSVNEIFLIFLQTLMSKEKEVMRTMRETFEKDRQKLVDEKQQSADTEKRATIWAKELESEIEKLQADLTGRERAQKEYQNKIFHVEHLLIESNHEKEILKEKMQDLETDFHNLQTEFDKQCKVDTRQEEAIFVAQKREKEAQETFKNKETELQSTLRLEKEMYEKKISDLAYTIESYKTKNLELNSAIEGLEVNEKQLKNIIEANSTEMRKKNHNIEKLNAELEHLTEAYNEMSQEMGQKTLHVKELTVILKNKCDLLSEYQTNLETVMPEYEMLKEHVRDQKTAIERYKEEIEMLKKERETQLEIIQDKLNTKEIQNAGLTKQLNELTNRNIALIEELNELKGKYEELQQTNAKLERKIRNSTSKIKAEAEIEELKELNKRLQTNLEGASNRVAEIQEIKNKTLKELVDLQGKYELLSQENNETKKTLASYKSKYSASSLLLNESKYDALLLEKNRIALELENKKLLLGQKDKELEECASKIQQLTEKNEEFDNELDEYAVIIQTRDSEISKLEDKLYCRLTENTHINELEEKLKGFREENEKLRDRAEALNIRLQQDMEQTREYKAQTEMVIHILKKEKLELQAKLNECKKQLELRLGETSVGQSSSSKKKVQISTEGECNRVTELQDEKNKMVNELVNLKRQYDILSQENIELKRTLEVYESKRKISNLSKDGGNKLDSILREKNNLAQELEAHKLLLKQKDRELKEYVNRIRDLTGENKEHDTGRDVGISKLESGSVIDLKEKLRIFREENRMLKNVTRELRLKLNACSERVPLNEESTGKKVGSIVSDKELDEYKKKADALKRQMHELELQLVSKNGKIATLEIQIQSENFPYQRKCKELEEHLLAFQNKNAELNSEVRKLQKAVNDVNAWECDICRRWRVNRKDQACQTIPNDALRFCSTNSGIVGEHLKIQKLEKEKALMKELCRSRSRRVKELETMVKELEEVQSSAVSRQHLLTDNST